MRKKLAFVAAMLVFVCLLNFSVGAASHPMSWYCTRQKAHRQAIAAPELRFVEELGGYYIDHAHDEGNAEKVVYLTFDAGYENGNVERILNTLRETKTPAAFFVLEHFVSHNTDLAVRMNEEGHLVCNHTATHKNLSKASKERIAAELNRLEEVCTQNGVRTAPFFRPPEGCFSEDMLRHVRSLGYKTVFWSFAYADWDNDKQPSEETALRCILDNVHNGAVLLLHPTSATNAAVLPRVIEELQAQGYRFGTLNELCGL